LDIKFENIIKEYHPILFKIGRVYSSDYDFDDLYQEMLINIWKGYNNFKGDSKLSTWVYRVALNTALTFKRDNSKHNKNEKWVHHFDIPDTHSNKEVEETERKIKRLYEAIGKLKADQKAIILLYLDKKSYDEISEITGLSESNVGVKINRIKKKLFNLLSH
jgi:RNA polymerase sigma-70 factor (ECF subfamily)